MKAILTVLFLICLATFSFAQVKISGKVLSKDKPISNVNVTLKDTYDGATSGADGDFSFETLEKGAFILEFSNENFESQQKKITIGNDNLIINVDLKQSVTEISAVVISAGSTEAGDKKRAAASITPMDVYQTAGANGSLAEGLKTYPGVQKTGESEGLFVRGGTGSETKFFVDGNLVNNYFSASVQGIPGRDRFNTDLFKGVTFSSGGYSALYGQALSAILSLESIDFPEKSSADFMILPMAVSGGFQKVNSERTHSLGINANYFNLKPITEILNYNTDFVKSPQSFGTNANFRFKTKSGGFLKYYGSFDVNSLEISQPSLELNYDTQQPEVKGKNTFQSLSFRQKFGRYLLKAGASFSIDDKNLNVGILNQNQKIGDVAIISNGTYLNQKTVLERKIKNASNVKAGYEINYSDDVFRSKILAAAEQKREVANTNFSIFFEANLALTTDFSVSTGLRAEHSSFLNHWNLAPRLAAAYRLSKSWVTSLAYGQFYQNPDAQFLTKAYLQPFQKASHYIFQIERTENKRTLRTEIFYKDYQNLAKSFTENFSLVPAKTVGKGFAKGFELFWMDKKTFHGLNYRVSYSYLDSRRDYLNYPQELFPSFAARHNLSVAGSKFFVKQKFGISGSFTYTSPRPFYNIVAQDGENFLMSSGHTKEFKSLNLSGFYLPNLGKNDAKSFTVLVAGINNILNFKNDFGYRFSQDGLRSAPILPATNVMFYIGARFSCGVDRTQETIDNL